jgi:methionyl-tRNA synthetase
MKKKRFYITTPIYYPSANPHLGNAYCTVMADIFARYNRMRGIPTFFLTGLDEHGQKIEKVALANKLSPKQYVDKIAINFKNLWSLLDITNDKFIRTTDTYHEETVQYIFSRLLKQEDIYLGNYKGWYCIYCESFWTSTQVGDTHVCPDCQREVAEASEETFFFKVNKYLPDVLTYYKSHPQFLLPLHRKKEMINNFITPGLEDLSVSRTSFTWGIKVPSYDKHVVYVWLDALTNYISALGYHSNDDTLFQQFWQDEGTEIVHLLGADINRFHSLYWPMFLKGLDLRLPTREFIHGLMMMKDGKMSKSKGNVIDPIALIDMYGSDAVRYYLAAEMHFGEDGQFTPELFIERLNADLANNFGNLVNRVVSMVHKYCAGNIPSSTPTAYTNVDIAINEQVEKARKVYNKAMDDLKLNDGINTTLDLLNAANKYIETTTPWALFKHGRLDELNNVLNILSKIVIVSSLCLSPIVPTITKKVINLFAYNDTPIDKLYKTSLAKLVDKQPLKVLDGVLFSRLDKEIEIEKVAALLK